MRIEKAKLGEVVLLKSYRDLPIKNAIGHIVGFGFNFYDEILIKVQLADGETKSIHPNNVELLS